MISEMIRKCTMLEDLVIPCAGLESILSAAQYLPRLKNVMLDCVTASVEEVYALRELRWSSYLREGEIDDFLRYDRHSHSWVEGEFQADGNPWDEVSDSEEESQSEAADESESDQS
eukprot:scaffold1561_cov184-Ochromonas_danica.AAC.2